MNDSHPISIQEIARKQIETTKRVYLLSPERMFSEFNGEQENVRNYNGRQLLEMLQNADDAASEATGEKKVLIKLLDNALIIANTGYPFSEDGLNSIFLSHLSPKEAKQNQIGKKGLGFRSILSWSKRVTIKSHDLKVSFSEEYSNSVLQELLLDRDFADKYKKLNKNHRSPISTLVCPNIENVELINFSDIDRFDTIIQIELNDNAKEEVKSQISQDLDAEVLLFLNNLQIIEIDLETDLKVYKKEIITNQAVRIKSISSDGNESIDDWNINSISGRFEDLDKAYQLSIAWQNNLTLHKDVIYSYFRTKVPFKSRGVLHGTFELNADRNLIINDSTSDKYNIRLINHLPELIAQVAESIANSEISKVSYKAVSFLHIDFNSLSHLTDASNLRAKLRDCIKTKKIFPTVRNRYINWSDTDKPVYYPEEEFAQFLNPDLFPDLLLCCENETDELLIDQLNPTTYQIEEIINEVAKNRHVLSTEDYAKLIVAIYKYIDSVKDINTISILYDEEKNLLKCDNKIFLPNDGINFILPSGLGVQIINRQLANNLEEVTKSSNSNALTLNLSKLKLKEYNFYEVAETLIKYYTSGSLTNESVVELNRYLFKLFLSSNNNLQNWIGTKVPLINKKREISLVNKLYLGREYQNALTEQIYKYAKEKIVAPPNLFRIDENEEEDWKKYLVWLGVEYLPRKVIINADKEYAEYVMRNYNYKKYVADYYFKDGFIGFKNNLNNYGAIEVTSIDDFDNILKNNTSERIIELIDKDETISKSLEKDKEPESSKIIFWFYAAKNARSISGSNMKSYLKWKIGNIAWLITESGIKCKPVSCSTAAYINEDFSGLIDKPKLDFELLKRININRDRIDYLLSIIGVHKSLNTFTTSMLYSILLKLPEIDIDGKKAKTIYNQLSVNFDDKQIKELDKQDVNYLKFHRDGKVFCKNGNYIPVKSVYYVNDKRYGESIIKQFNVIEIDRRRGKEKIKNIFGVKSLDNIELSLVGEPKFHNVNSNFENEIESFKPYVYVLRKDVDSGTEKNIIKDTRFKLVNKLQVKLSKDDAEFSFELNSYEYFYLKSRNIVYVIAPLICDDLQQLKDDIYFCSTVAEAFSAILDVDAQRQQIRELFSKNSQGRDELIRSEIEDENLMKLTEAKTKLGIVSNPKIDFWKAYTKCFEGKIIKLYDDTDKDLLESLRDNFLEYEEEINDVFNSINYYELNEVESSELIVKLFKKSGVSIYKFNQFHYPTLDIKQLYDINFKESVNRYFDKFKVLYYNKCLIEDELQFKFLDVLNEYKFLKGECMNEIDFNTDNDLVSITADKYNINLDEQSGEINWSEIYSNNTSLLLGMIREILTEVNLLNQFLKEDLISQSLIYFINQLPIIESRFREWIGKSNLDKSLDNTSKRSKRISFGDNTILYDDLVELKDHIDQLINSNSIAKITSKNIKISKLDIPKNNNGQGASSKTNSRRPKVPKEEIGFLGEYLVYRYLLEHTEDKDSVKWVSEYAKDCGINLDGKDGLGYDIEYIPNGGKHLRYVEVKVVGWEDAFHISSNEVKQGESLKKYYEIFLVRNLESATEINIEKIQGLFDYKGKSFTDNDLFSVINDNFIIKFKKQ